MRIRLSRAVVFALFCLTHVGWASGENGKSESLFDGKSLKHWTVEGCEAEVQDGSILLKAGNGMVQTREQFGDCRFECEWKALRDNSWDSGIYFRYTSKPAGRPWPNRYQVNLRKGMEGDLGGVKEGDNRVPIKPGKWNSFTLTLKGSTAELRVNGEFAWKVDGITPARGFIGLQAEVPGGGQFLFRNLRITRLSAR